MKILGLLLMMGCLVSTSVFCNTNTVRLKPGQSYLEGNVTIVVEAEEKKPSVSRVCIAKKSNGDCTEYDYIYGVNGVTCTEDCLKQGSFSKCKLRNKCEFIPQSGCFEKHTCTDINSLNNCRMWEKEVICK